MARGKHAARAARQANEAAVQHIDRLTTELVTAKMRARSVEASARAVPALRARVEELERLMADDEHVAAAYDQCNEYWGGEMRRVLRSAFEIIDSLTREYEGAVARNPTDELQTCAALERAMSELPPTKTIVGLTASRGTRRIMGQVGSANWMSNVFEQNIPLNHALNVTQPEVIERLAKWKEKGTSPRRVADDYTDELAANSPKRRVLT